MIILDTGSRRTKTLTLRVDDDLNKLIEKAVKLLGYKSKSDYIRDALVEFLKEFEKRSEVKVSNKKRISRNARTMPIIYV